MKDFIIKGVEDIKELFNERLDSSLFESQKWVGLNGISIITVFDSDSGRPVNRRFDCRGWCYSDSLKVKSKSNGIAIMLFDNETREEVWCHVSMTLLETLYRKYQLNF